MDYTEIKILKSDALSLTDFKEMDYFAVEKYRLSIEMMMENAGLQLANLVADSVKDSNSKVLIGIGNGNNGGGGLVSARRLKAWGYDVYLDSFTKIDKYLPNMQLERALKFGVKMESEDQPDVWVDAYLGFSQRLPLPDKLMENIDKANQTDCMKISLDIPTGYLGDPTLPHFQSDKVLSLAASKKILYDLSEDTEVFIADLGIPEAVYKTFNINMPPFHLSNLIKLAR